MERYSHAHLSPRAQLDGARAAARSECSSLADLISYLADIESSKAYLEEAYGSLHAWCVGELNLCDQAAYKRIGAARYARDFPALFAAVADGRLHLSAVTLIGPHLTRETADGLIVAATHRTKAQIERMLAERKQPNLAPIVSATTADPAVKGTQLSPGIVAGIPTATTCDQPAPAPVIDRVSLPAVPRATYEKLRYLKSLLSHQVSSGDLAEVIDRVCDVAIAQLEKRKFGATDRPRHGTSRAKVDGRHIPMVIRQTVWKRDDGRCTFTSDNGRRCESTTRLEFDHIVPVARGGETTVGNLRLLCRAHNQHQAERAFGAEFMKYKREQRSAPNPAAATATIPSPDDGRSPDPDRDVTPWLRALDVSAKDAKRAAEYCETLGDVTLEERVKAALSFLLPPHRRSTTRHLESAA